MDEYALEWYLDLYLMKSIINKEIDRNTLKAEHIAPLPINVNCDEDVNYW